MAYQQATKQRRPEQTQPFWLIRFSMCSGPTWWQTEEQGKGEGEIGDE